MADLSPIQKSKEWCALEQHQAEISAYSLNGLFKSNSSRFEEYSVKSANIFLDYSKHFLTTETLDLLMALANKAELKQAIIEMFAGQTLNNTEQRPALHVALRGSSTESKTPPIVEQTLTKMEDFTNLVLSGEWKGYQGQAITDVVNIGIGGSDLGPAMVYEALTPFQQKHMHCHFISNIDPCHLSQMLEHLNPATTLFLVASKTFSTLETLKNAETAKHWLLSSAQDKKALAKHFVAMTANTDNAKSFGVAEDNIFPLWDWVGGRFSLWSAIGLPLALGLGMDNFNALLKGAHQMDEHYLTAPLEKNIPVIMALLNIWYINFFKAETQVVLPYFQNLHLLPAFLQQLEMESLGKSVRKDGSAVEGKTGAIIWGSAGTNGQHSFHQLLHQGTHLIPADFIAVAQSPYSDDRALEQHQYLLANCFAQSQALMQGKSFDSDQANSVTEEQTPDTPLQLAPHKSIVGNKPSTTLLLQTLSPESLGSLIACYEHKVYSQSVILQINAFDQWGVQLGKSLSTELFQHIKSRKDMTKQGLENESDQVNTLDGSTQGLIDLL